MFDDYNKLNNLYLNAFNHRSQTYAHKKNDEEFYYSDVEKTRTQFTKAQEKTIKTKYDIPISSKIAHAIIEQIISFVTGTKPSFRFITEAYNDQDYAYLFQDLIQAIWYECGVNNELTQMLQDTFIVGNGYIHCRKSNFFNESTFNVVIEHVDWKSVFVDPTSRKADESDASWKCIAKVMTVDAAEKMFDIKIEEKEFTMAKITFPYDLDHEILDQNFYNEATNKKTRYTITREFYQKELVTLWMDENGNVTNKRPTITTAPNPEHIALTEQLTALRMQYEQAAAELMQYQQQEQKEINELATGTNQVAAMQQMEQSENESSGIREQVRQLEQAVKDLEYTLAKTDPTVSAYNFTRLAAEESHIAYEVSKQKKKRVVRTFVVHNQILEREVLPIDEIPIINCAHLHLNSPARTYGMMHLIKDFEKAINKFLQGAVYNVQLTGSPRMMANKGVIPNRQNFESAFSTPGSLIEIDLNPELQGKDIPIPLAPQPISEAHVRLIEMCMQMSEYVSGIHSIVQGNSDTAPNTLGGINSLLTFGTQRVKHYGRAIENALQRLAYVVAQMLHAYAPRNQVLKYFDENQDEKEIKILDTPDDVRFRVRTNMVMNMGTQKQLAATLLATIAGQTSSPEVANLLTEEAVKYLELPQADEFLKKLDTVKMMQQQINQLQQDNDAKAAQLRMMTNNMSNKEIAQKQKESEMAIEYETQKQLDTIQQQEESYNQIPEIAL